MIGGLGVTPEMLRWLHSHLGIPTANLEYVESRGQFHGCHVGWVPTTWSWRCELLRMQDVGGRKIPRWSWVSRALWGNVHFRQTKAVQIAVGCSKLFKVLPKALSVSRVEVNTTFLLRGQLLSNGRPS
eukprot:2443775-Amphidinium_carterae.1